LDKGSKIPRLTQRLKNRTDVHFAPNMNMNLMHLSHHPKPIARLLNTESMLNISIITWIKIHVYQKSIVLQYMWCLQFQFSIY